MKLAYDYSHFQFRDLPLSETLQQMLPLTRFIHVKDTVLDKGKARFVLPGEGGFDYVPLPARGGRVGVSRVHLRGGERNGFRPARLRSHRRGRAPYDNLAPAFEKAGVART